MRYEHDHKPEQCPKCGSDRVATILYGYPALSDKLEEDLRAGRITLGGSLVTDDDPRWRCLKCSAQIYEKSEPGEPG